MYVSEKCNEGGSLGWMLNDSFGNTFKDWCLVPYAGQTIVAPDNNCGNTALADFTTHQCYAFFDRSGGTPPPNQQAGEPIDMGSGNLFYQVIDYQGGDAFPLVLKRTYNSGIANEASSLSTAEQSMGPGWTSGLVGAHLNFYLASPVFVVCTDDGSGYPSGPANDPNYGRQFVCPSSPDTVQGSVTVWHADGSQAVFTGEFSLDTGLPVGIGSLAPEARSTGELSWNGTVYLYQRVDGYTETYDAKGKLNSVQDPRGLQQTYAYSGGQLVSVTDPNGRQMSITYDANGRIQTVIVPSHVASTGTATITYVYDSTSGDLLTATYQDTHTNPAYQTTVTYEYSDSALVHALTGIKDEDGNEFAAWSYDDTSMKAVCSELAPSANATSTATTCLNDAGGTDRVLISYNADGSADVTEGTGLVRHLTFTNVNGRSLLSGASARCTDCGASSQTITYDSNGDGYVAQTTDFAGNTSTYLHDASTGLELSRTEGLNPDPSKNVGRTITTTWCGPQSVGGNNCINPSYALDTVTEPGRVTSHTYYPSGQVHTRTVTDPATGQSRTTTYAYYPGGLLNTVTDPLGNATTYVYTNTGTGDLHTITNALNQTTTTIGSYSASGLPLSVTDQNNLVTQLSYDARGRLASRKLMADNTQILFTYYPSGNLEQVTLPTLSTLTYSYDHAHRLTQVSDGAGDSIVYTLDAYGNRTEEDTCASAAGCGPNSTADLRVHMRKYNALNEITDEIGGMGQDTVYSNYDGDGNAQTITDARNNPTTVEFDALNRLDHIVDPENGNVHYNYDPLDRLQDLTDPKGLNTHHERDAFGEVTQLVSPDTGTTNYDYSAWVSAAAVTKTDARGVTSIYSYDPLYRLRSVSYPSDASRNVTYTYDQGPYGIGRLYQVADASGTTVYAYDAHGNVAQKTVTLDGHVFVVGYQYDAGDNLSGMTYPGGMQVRYNRDSTDRISSVTENDTPVVSNVTYQPFGPVTGLSYGNNLLESRSYDLDYRITSVNVQGVLSLSLQQNNCTPSAPSAYDNNNNILSITDNLQGSNSQCFGYDDMNRLTSASGAYGSLTYGYDTVGVLDGYDGNRTQENLNGAVTSLTYDIASNRLLSVGAQSYSYDAMGDLTGDGSHSYDYDVAGRLSGFDDVTFAYAYNGLGQRVIKFPDVTPPSISITAPVNGAFVSGSVALAASASASDSISVTGVQYHLDGGNLGGSLGSSPYAISWDTTQVSDGPHILTASATDAARNSATSAALTVTVDNSAPIVEITVPTDPNVSGTTTLSAYATDNFSVASVWFRLDGVDIPGSVQTAPSSGSTYSYGWDTTAAAAGSHALTAVAKDAAGNITTSSALTVIVPDTTPPTVSITNPPAGNVSGTVSITATANDDVGVTSVQFQLDGTNLGSADTTAPYSHSWNTSAYNGTHVLTAIASDATGHTTTSAPVNVLLPPTAPNPLHISPATSSNGSFTLSWTAPASTTQYRVYQSTNNGNFVWVDTFGNSNSGTINRTESGLTQGYYTFHVWACNGSGCSGASPDVSAVVMTSAPTKPTGMGITPGSSSNGKFTLSWTSPPAATQYRVYESANGGNYVWVDTFNNSSFGTITRLEPQSGSFTAGSYTFYVLACNSNGCSPQSATVTGTVPSGGGGGGGCPPPPYQCQLVLSDKFATVWTGLPTRVHQPSEEVPGTRSRPMPRNALEPGNVMDKRRLWFVWLRGDEAVDRVYKNLNNSQASWRADS